MVLAGEEPRQRARSELVATFVEQVGRGTSEYQIELELGVPMRARWAVGRRVKRYAPVDAVPQPEALDHRKKR